MAVVYNPFDAETRRDPYPVYHRLRREDPIHRSAFIPGWMLTRYADVHAVLRDPRFSVDRTRSKLFRGPHSPLKLLGERMRTTFLNMLLFKDPPDHTRLRHLVNKAFTPRMVERLRPRLQEVVDEAIDAVAGKGEMELIADFAHPLPVTVIAELMGIPAGDRELFRTWADRITNLLEPTALIDPAVRERAEVTLVEMRAYFDGVFTRRRADPREDLVTGLLAAKEGADRLDDEELFAMCVLLLIAGHETTTNLIGNAVLTLLRNPDERKRLRDDPRLLPDAVEEFLRYESVAQATARIATEDVELDGHLIEEGDAVLLSLGAANRDPAAFAHPDRVDVGRRENRHLAFGFGAHFCLGASLARVEAQIALGTLLRRLPTFDGDAEDPHWKPTGLLRGLAALPLRF